jgi:tetratricopeptide (TPR) repeat protein
LDEAIRYYGAALAVRPGNPGAYVNLGNALKDRGDLDGAINAYRAALEGHPDYTGAHERLGQAYRVLKQYDRAVAEYTRVIELTPNDAHSWSTRGIFYCDHMGQPDKAVTDFSRAIELDPKSAIHWSNRGIAHRKLRQYDEAVADFSKAIELDPKYADAWSGRGRVYHELCQYDKARADWEKAIELNPKSAELHTSFGSTLWGLGKLDEAISAYREAIRLKKDFALAHYNLGNSLRDKGQLDDAIAKYRKAILLKKDYPEAHCNLGYALRLQGHFREALEAMRRGHELGFRKPGWRYPSARWVEQCKHLVELNEKLPDILKGKTRPASHGERLELASICSLKRLHRAAARFYEEALAAEPALADDPGNDNRYNAACAAALAGCGQGKEADKLKAPERARLRRQALEWLRAELDAWGRVLDKKPDRSARATQALQHWQVDADLAGVRGPEALAKLPEAERQPWQKLWQDVSKTLARARATSQKKGEVK